MLPEGDDVLKDINLVRLEPRNSAHTYCVTGVELITDDSPKVVADMEVKLETEETFSDVRLEVSGSRGVICNEGVLLMEEE
jgi:hypothetical protein